MRFPGRYSILEQLSEYVAGAAEEAGLDGRALYAVRLAVDEAATNIIQHAYGGEDVGDFECDCQVTDEGLEIVLRDWGTSFDPASVPEPDFSVDLEELPDHGAGMLLIRRLMDEVAYKMSAEGNTISMLKRRG